MCNFTIGVELKGRPIDDDVYRRLDVLMETEGFKRKILPPTRFHATNLFTHPDNPPHATYEGRYDGDTSALIRGLEIRIKGAIQCESVVFAAKSAH